MRKMTAFVGIGVIGLLVACVTAWISLAIYYSGPPGDYLRAGLAGLFPRTTLAAFFVLPRRGPHLVLVFCSFCTDPGLVDNDHAIKHPELAGRCSRATLRDHRG